MILELAQDGNLLSKIMSDDDIWEKIREDGLKKSDLCNILPANMVIVSAKIDDIIGLHIFSWHNDRVLYHPMLLKPYRKQFGREFMKKGIEWFFKNTSSEALEAEIPINHISTINLAENMKFQKVGVVKDGKY
jgi:hypothetical protein